MLLIDKTKQTQTLIVTITETIQDASNVLKLKVFNKGTNQNFLITLPANSSPHTVRYDQFTFSTSLVANWPEGMYVFNIVEMQDSFEVQELEIGLLKVVGISTQQFIENEISETEDDFIEYNI